MLTEEELRGGLRALTAGAPPTAPERVASSVRRARFIRARQVVAGSAAAAALIVPGVAFLSSFGPSDPSTPANWAYRPNPVWRPAADRAFAEWNESNQLPAGERVRWLYSDEVPGTGEVAVAFATCRKKNCSRLVLMTAEKAEAGKADGDPGSSAWDTEVKDIDPGAHLPVLSTFLDPEGSGDRSTQENVLFVLPMPNAERVTYRSRSVRSGTGGHGALRRQPDGSYVGRLGYLSSEVTVGVYDADDDLLQYDEVAEVGNTRWVGNVTVPRGYSHMSSGRGQLKDTRQAFESFTGDTPPFTIFVRCAGKLPMQVIAGGRTRSVTCDGTVRKAAEGLPGTDGHMFRIESGDPYTAFAWAIAVPS